VVGAVAKQPAVVKVTVAREWRGGNAVVRMLVLTTASATISADVSTLSISLRCRIA